MTPLGFDLKGFVSKFNGDKFVRTWVSRRASRWLGEVLDGIGPDNVRYCIRNDKDILSYIPADIKKEWAMNIQPYKHYESFFDDETLYSWIPENWKVFIESEPAGKAWAQKLVLSVRHVFFSS